MAELVDLGERLMRPGGDEAVSRGRKSQLAYRDGLMIAFLALRPLRLRNFTTLTLGESLMRQGTGWWIVLAAEVTKNRRPLELPFPDTLVPALEHYLARVRPWLLGSSDHLGCSTGGALWISLRGTPMSPASIYEQITLHTKAAFGRALNPHLFRDCAVTSLAIAAPEAVRAGGLRPGHMPITPPPSVTTTSPGRLTRPTATRRSSPSLGQQGAGRAAKRPSLSQLASWSKKRVGSPFGHPVPSLLVGDPEKVFDPGRSRPHPGGRRPAPRRRGLWHRSPCSRLLDVLIVSLSHHPQSPLRPCTLAT